MGIDQAGQHDVPREVDDHIRPWRQAVSFADGFDEAVTNQHFAPRNFTACIVHRDENARVADQQSAH